GTPAYMSPEQARSQPIDARSDVYSLGIVVFEWLTGKMPFRADTPIGLLLKQIEEPVPPVRTFRADISPQVEAVIMRACAKNPSERFTSAGEFFMAFSQAIKGEGVSSSPPPYNYDPHHLIYHHPNRMHHSRHLIIKHPNQCMADMPKHLIPCPKNGIMVSYFWR
ncbi:MAG TPA: protein kinase, partial [Aggregatilineales bacterium]|nr:protein kinase [Aggregatilineales bacterium]